MIEYFVTFKNDDEEISESKKEILDICRQHKKSEINQVFSKTYKKIRGEWEEDWVEILFDERMGIDKGIKFKGG
jgi:hypothetical protein